MNADVLIQAPLADEGLITHRAVETLGRVVQSSVHLQVMFGGKALSTDPAGMWPHACMVQHVDAQRVQLGQGLATNVTHKLTLGATFRLTLEPIRELIRRSSSQRCFLALLMLMTSQVGTKRDGILELFITQLGRDHSSLILLDLDTLCIVKSVYKGNSSDFLI